MVVNYGVLWICGMEDSGVHCRVPWEYEVQERLTAR